MRAEIEINNAIAIVLASPKASFTTLVRLAKLDPKHSFRFAVLTDVDFSEQDLAGFNFHGADLTGCKFDNARILGANFAKANIDPASLAAAADWRAYRQSQQEKKTAWSDASTHPKRDLTYEQALRALRQLLREKKKVRSSTLETMMEVAPTLHDATLLLKVLQSYGQELTGPLINSFATKLSGSLVNSWLQKIIEANLGKDIRNRAGEPKHYLEVEMSNLLGLIGREDERQSFNQMLVETYRLEEVFALMNYYGGRRWTISSAALVQIVRKLGKDENLELQLPDSNYVGPRFTRFVVDPSGYED